MFGSQVLTFLSSPKMHSVHVLLFFKLSLEGSMYPRVNIRAGSGLNLQIKNVQANFASLCMRSTENFNIHRISLFL